MLIVYPLLRLVLQFGPPCAVVHFLVQHLVNVWNFAQCLILVGSTMWVYKRKRWDKTQWENISETHRSPGTPSTFPTWTFWASRTCIGRIAWIHRKYDLAWLQKGSKLTDRNSLSNDLLNQSWTVQLQTRWWWKQGSKKQESNGYKASSEGGGIKRI